MTHKFTSGTDRLLSRVDSLLEKKTLNVVKPEPTEPLVIPQWNIDGTEVKTVAQASALLGNISDEDLAELILNSEDVELDEDLVADAKEVLNSDQTPAPDEGGGDTGGDAGGDGTRSGEGGSETGDTPADASDASGGEKSLIGSLVLVDDDPFLNAGWSKVEDTESKTQYDIGYDEAHGVFVATGPDGWSDLRVDYAETKVEALTLLDQSIREQKMMAGVAYGKPPKKKGRKKAAGMPVTKCPDKPATRSISMKSESAETETKRLAFRG